MKFRKKPVVIEARRWTGDNLREVVEFIQGKPVETICDMARDRWDDYVAMCLRDGLQIKTLEDGPNGEAKHVASIGDWIIKGVKGEFYPCKPDIFAATYDPVPTTGDLNGTSPLPPAPEAAPTDSLIAAAKQIAWAHWMATHPHDTSANAEELWHNLNSGDHKGYLAAARAVAGRTQPHVSTAARQVADLLVLSRLPDCDARPSPSAAKARMERVRSVRSEDFGPFQRAVEDAVNEALVVLTAIAAWDEKPKPQTDAALVEVLREVRSFVSDTAQAAKSGWGSAPDEEALLAKIDAALRAHQEASDAREQAALQAEFDALKEDGNRNA